MPGSVPVVFPVVGVSFGVLMVWVVFGLRPMPLQSKLRYRLVCDLTMELIGLRFYLGAHRRCTLPRHMG